MCDLLRFDYVYTKYNSWGKGKRLFDILPMVKDKAISKTDIAKLLNVSIGTVKRWLEYAKMNDFAVMEFDGKFYKGEVSNE